MRSSETPEPGATAELGRRGTDEAGIDRPAVADVRDRRRSRRPGGHELTARGAGLAAMLAVALAVRWAGGATGLPELSMAMLLGITAGIAARSSRWPGLQRLVHASEMHGSGVLRLGVVLLGARISAEALRGLGLLGVVVVMSASVCAFVVIRGVGPLLGLSRPLSLLTATGYSICGVSAVAAMTVVADADDDEAAYAVALVSLCGTVSMFLFPVVGHGLGVDGHTFGVFVGASVHDVGQVTAASAAFGPDALASATLVKLVRVVLLAPLVLIVGMTRRGGGPASGSRGVKLVPPFVVGFAVVAIAALVGLVPAGFSATYVQPVDQLLLAGGMFGLGCGVKIQAFRRLGLRPLLFGAVAWIFVGMTSFVVTCLVA